MRNQSPPMGRMLRRALDQPAKTSGYLFRRFKKNRLNYVVATKWKSLNTHGVKFRVRQLQWDCLRLRKGLGELYTPDQQNAHLAKPVTKKDILTGYLMAARYNNNFKPRV